MEDLEIILLVRQNMSIYQQMSPFRIFNATSYHSSDEFVFGAKLGSTVQNLEVHTVNKGGNHHTSCLCICSQIINECLWCISHKNTKQAQSHHVIFKQSNCLHKWVNKLAKSFGSSLWLGFSMVAVPWDLTWANDAIRTFVLNYAPNSWRNGQRICLHW